MDNNNKLQYKIYTFFIKKKTVYNQGRMNNLHDEFLCFYPSKVG